VFTSGTPVASFIHGRAVPKQEALRELFIEGEPRTVRLFFAELVAMVENFLFFVTDLAKVVVPRLGLVQYMSKTKAHLNRAPSSRYEFALGTIHRYYTSAKIPWQEHALL